MFSCLQILDGFLWFVLITVLNVTLIILTLSVSRFVSYMLRLFFFFQAEDGIRDLIVTGVQTCALPILPAAPTGDCCGEQAVRRGRWTVEREQCQRLPQPTARVRMAQGSPRRREGRP